MQKYLVLALQLSGQIKTDHFCYSFFSSVGSDAQTATSAGRFSSESKYTNLHHGKNKDKSIKWLMNNFIENKYHIILPHQSDKLNTHFVFNC